MKRIIITFIIITSIIIIAIFMPKDVNIIRVLDEAEINNQMFSLSIIQDKQQVYFTGDIEQKFKYNTIMLPMDIIFSQLFDNYQVDKEEQELIYEDFKLIVKRDENLIKVPNVYKVETSQIDDSVDVEIEEFDEKKYIPIYLITNIPGIQVFVDSKEIYNDKKYYNSYDGINNKEENHNIGIKVTRNKEEKISNEYVGREEGALWREEALKRIEKYRKRDISIIVKNQNGNEIENANVTIKMNNNEFKFGTAIRKIEDTKVNKYDGITRNLFNSIGSENGFKWSVLSHNGVNIPNDIIRYSNENEMNVRGHYLWQDSPNDDLKGLVGDINSIEESTMTYIYNKYNNGEIDLEQANIYIEKLKENFENKVFDHIKNTIEEFSDVNEWDVVNEPLSKQYFKYYLYDKKLLTDSTFLTSESVDISEYEDNDEYYRFLAKCFDKAIQIKEGDNKLLLNSGKINGNFASPNVNKTIDIINNIKKYTENIEALGVQYHVWNNYRYTPQTYYNLINNVLEKTGLTEAIVTEYDNYLSSKMNNYTDEEKKLKADYLRDTLIACYSNQNISGFYFWVYNSGTGSFVKEERKVYEELMEKWLNDKQIGLTDEKGTYSARTYKGEYTATVEINGLIAEKNFKINSETDDIVEIIINNNIEKIEIKQLPNKIQYIQGKEELDLTGGILKFVYTDGTTKEILLSDENVKVSNFNNANLGKQTIVVKFGELETSFTVEVIKNQIEEISSQILQSYEEFEQNYSKEIQKIQNAKGIILRLKENMKILQEYIVIENSRFLQQYATETINLSFSLIVNNMNNENVYSIINDTNKILTLYEQLNNLALKKDNIMNIQEISEGISTFENKTTYYEDLNLSKLKDYIKQSKIYLQSMRDNSIYVINAKFLVDSSNTILDNYISNYLEENPVILNYNTKELTNQDVAVSLVAEQDTTIKILNSNNEDVYLISENGQYVIEYSRRNFKDKIIANINWIDKKAPLIEGIQDKGVYTEPVKITVSDENIDNITFNKNGQHIGFTNGDIITDEGEYKIVATDKAKNETTYMFTYINLNDSKYEVIDNKYIINIEPNTTVEQFLNNIQMDLICSIENGNKQLGEKEKISTGTIMKIANDKTYTLIVTGDVTGDGNINIADLVKLNLYSIGKINLEKIYELAGDVNHDKSLNIGDLVRLNLYSIGKIITL